MSFEMFFHDSQAYKIQWMKTQFAGDMYKLEEDQLVSGPLAPHCWNCGNDWEMNLERSALKYFLILIKRGSSCFDVE